MFLMELTQTVSDSGGDDDTALTFTRFSHLVTIPHLFAAMCGYNYIYIYLNVVHLIAITYSMFCSF